MKKLVCVLLAVLLTALTGCGRAKKESVYTADNEIFSYQKIDAEKTQIVVSRTGNINVKSLCEAFEAANPDVQVIYLDITGGNEGYKPFVDWITRGYRPDVTFSGTNFFERELTTDYFENLSLDPIIQNYEAEALARTAVDSEVYSLPGPSNISAMMYNRTLFERYGWEVPKTFDEFIALCDQIREDTNGEVEPWNPNAKYDMELQTAIEAFTYEEIFGGADNRTWYNDFTAGAAAFAGHMEPYMQVLQTLVDHDILREEHFSYSATTRGKEFASGKIAMINVNIYDADNEEFDFSYMPFPTTKGELGYLCDSYNCYVGLPVKEHTEAEQDAIARFLAFFSSGEGQKIYVGESMMVSNVKDVPLNQADDLAALQSAISAGHMFAFLDFSSTVGQSRNLSLQQCAMDIVSGESTGAECIAEIDMQPYSAPDVSEQAQPEIIATAPKDMTILETSFYIADAYREAANADIALITNNETYRGNVMKLFAGDVTAGMVNVLKPRSLANDSTLVKVLMTGRQLVAALNAPVGNEDTANCIYAYSGLKCEVAPWNALGSKYLSVALEDGKQLQPDELYTVAVWAGTVRDDCVTETLETYDGTWEELITAKLRADGTVTAPDDGRIKLSWQ